MIHESKNLEEGKLLEGIMDVPWSELGGFEVPRWIMDLASADQSIRLAAHRHLKKQVIDKGARIPEDFGNLEDILKTDVAFFTIYFITTLLHEIPISRTALPLDLIAILSGNISLNWNNLTHPVKGRAERIMIFLRDNIKVFTSLVHSESVPASELAAEILDNLKDS
ncbi:MAG: hypothetical protein U0670_02515 [Anaerolineae bacterium]